MIESGQKIYIQTLNPLSAWKTLDEDVEIESYRKKKYKLSFDLSLKAHEEVMLSLIPPYTYSKLLRDLERY